jgi:hypothetical protein
MNLYEIVSMLGERTWESAKGSDARYRRAWAASKDASTTWSPDVPGGQTATDARGLGGLAGVLYRYPPGHSVDVVPQVKRANELFDGPLA